MKFIKKLFIFIFVIIVIALAASIGGYIYVYKTYDIDLIKNVKELKNLSAPVDESVIITHPFNEDDMVDAKDLVNQSIKDFITSDELLNNVINFDGTHSLMTSSIKVNDKQVGALANQVITQELDGKITIADNEFPLTMRQVVFDYVSDNEANINLVATIDVSSFKETLKAFPFSYIKPYIPDVFYVSSTFNTKKGTEAFSFNVKHNQLTINQLTSEETTDLFHTIDVIFKFGSCESLNLMIANTFMNALIGSESEKGLAYSLKEYGAKDYCFSYEDDTCYFKVLVDLLHII
ncbi:MAG: hypothetical protein MR270_06945 [Erysipelotrichaceae bacterium]|nr:hypothetical protein [Erysipelotrichaceae bacterium]